MGHYLRDERITNLSIKEDNLKQLSSVFSDRAQTIDANEPQVEKDVLKVFQTYIIRFDHKGYRVFTLQDLLKYFHLAKDVERVIFTVETVESLRSNRQTGTYLELRLDEKDPKSCVLAVSGDDKDWVDASFAAVKDILGKCANKTGWLRTGWTPFLVQILGTVLGFIFSLWAAVKIAPLLAIENPLLIAFLFVLVVFSNTWSYLNQRILAALLSTFPPVKFLRADKERLHWLLQAIVGGIMFAIVIYVLNQAFGLLLEMLDAFVRRSP